MDLIKGVLGELGSELVTDVLVPALLPLVAVTLTLPIYFIIKKVSGSKTTFGEDVWKALTAQQQPARPSPYLEELSGLRSGLETVGLYIMYGAIVLVTGFIIYFFATLRDDANKAFLQAVFGIGYLVFMLFAVGQALAIKSGRVQRKRKPITHVTSNIDRTSGARTINFSFEFGVGGPPAQANVQIDSVPDEDKLDANALETAQSQLDIGEGLESVCRSINPRFADWQRPRQEAYKAYLQSVLGQRSRGGASSPDNAAIRGPVSRLPDPEPAEITTPSEVARPYGKAPFSPAQLVLIVMVFLGALATFLTFMMLSSRMRS